MQQLLILCIDEGCYRGHGVSRSSRHVRSRCRNGFHRIPDGMGDYLHFPQGVGYEANGTYYPKGFPIPYLDLITY